MLYEYQYADNKEQRQIKFDAENKEVSWDVAWPNEVRDNNWAIEKSSATERTQRCGVADLSRVIECGGEGLITLWPKPFIGI